jgi:TrmH family RNA methyltransferase
MVTKNQIKLINSLNRKKNRYELGLFVAEGHKVIQEFLNAGYTYEYIFCTQENLFKKNTNVEIITEAELKKISFLTNPNDCLAVFRIVESQKSKVESQNQIPNTQNQIIVALDDINDPGNLGTIIRLCDWFGTTEIICSENTVDVYNPKVVQSTMGSLARINVIYTDLPAFLKTTTVPIIGTFMEGDNVYKTTLPESCILVMGNEANGISKSVEALVTDKISIPRFGNIQLTESLNVATATAILLSEFKRR